MWLHLDSRTGAREQPVRRNHQHNHEGQVIDMARPEKISDIELSPIQFATVQVSDIASHGALLEAYARFMVAAQKAGAMVEVKYNGATFERMPTDQEQKDQLKGKQASWDEGKRQYEIKAAVGECEYSYMESMAKSWAAGEGMPWPPEHEPISEFDAVIRGIDAVTE